jgi:hypothetical protein
VGGKERERERKRERVIECKRKEHPRTLFPPTSLSLSPSLRSFLLSAVRFIHVIHG